MGSLLPPILGRPLGYFLLFPLMALIGDHIYLHFSMGFRCQPRIILSLQSFFPSQDYSRLIGVN